MARRLAAVLALLLLGATLFTSGSRPQAATTSCVWTKHTKRVVTHVRHHGKRERIVHRKHYWTCRKVAAPTPSATTAAAPSSPAPTPPGESAPTPEPEPNALGVVANDKEHHFTYEPTRLSVKPGQLTVQLNNIGEDPHNMDMQKIGESGPEGEIIEMPLTGPKSQSTKSVEVQAGTYRMWCTLGHHAEEGMEAEITVK